MGLFNFNKNQIVQNLTPLRYRVDGFLQFLYGLFEGIKDLFFLSDKNYNNQDGVSPYNPATTYAANEIILEMKSGNVYQSLVSSNTATLDDVNSWRKISSSIIGLSESVNYNATNISITYALNKRYQTTFLPDPDVFVSDIYIEGIVDGLDMFQVGEIETNSSWIAAGNYNSSDGYICAANTSSYQAGFKVKVSSIWWPTYFSTFSEVDSSIRNFLNQYVPIGIFYETEEY